MTDEIQEIIKSWAVEEGPIGREWVKRGREEGLAEGLKSGREEGLEKGRKAGIARNIWQLIQHDFPLTEIAMIFGTTEKEVAAIAQKYIDQPTNEQKP